MDSLSLALLVSRHNSIQLEIDLIRKLMRQAKQQIRENVTKVLMKTYNDHTVTIIIVKLVGEFS